MRRSTKRLAAAVLIAALGILSACGTSAAPETTPFPRASPPPCRRRSRRRNRRKRPRPRRPRRRSPRPPRRKRRSRRRNPPGGAHAHARPARPGGNVHLCGRGRRRMEAGAAQRRPFTITDPDGKPHTGERLVHRCGRLRPLRADGHLLRALRVQRRLQPLEDLRQYLHAARARLTEEILHPGRRKTRPNGERPLVYKGNRRRISPATQHVL